MAIHTSIDGVVKEVPTIYCGVDGAVREIATLNTSQDGVIKSIYENFKETKKWYPGCTLEGTWFGGRFYSTTGFTTNSDGSQNPTASTSYCNFESDGIKLRQSSTSWSSRGAVCFNQKITKDMKWLYISTQTDSIGLCVELYSSWSNAMDYHTGSNISGENNKTPPNETDYIEQNIGTSYINVNVDGRNTGKTLWFMLSAYNESVASGYSKITEISFMNKIK